jgi:hypothetical protein
VHSKEDDNDCIKFSDPFVLLSFNSSSNLYRHWKFILRFVKHDSWTVSEPGLLLEGSPKGLVHCCRSCAIVEFFSLGLLCLSCGTKEKVGN